MNVRNLIGAEDTVILKRGLLIYESDTRAFATVHEVRHQEGCTNGPPTFAPGRPISRELLLDLERRLSNVPVMRRTVLPACVLYADSTRLAWHRPALRRPIWFNTKDKAFNAELDGATVLHPALLFLAGPGLSIYALPSDDRPTADTVLCRAPYYNLYEHGGMCAGDTRLPERISVADLALWETAFYDTRFTHPNIHGNTKLTAHKGGHDGLWRDMRTGGVFPPEHLVPLKKTLQEALDQ